VIKVTVYVPAYNASNFLALAIESLQRQTLPPDQIFVVDDGSRDPTAEIASGYSQVTLLRHERNRGLAAARNTAFRSARNELVASLDADCVAEPDWLARLVTHLDEPGVVGAGGRLVEGVQLSIADRWRRAHMPQEWGDSYLRNPKFLFGCNNLFRRSTVLNSGGYDESMRTNGEDCDLSRRLMLDGHDLVYDPSARATHLRRDSIRSIFDTYWRWWKSGVNAYSNGVRLRSVIGHAIFVHFRYTFLELFFRDIRARRFELLPLDVLLLGYLPYRDLRLWLASNSAEARQRSQAGA
jgi:glycosyltransferase involved in cell wall biosynthesis